MKLQELIGSSCPPVGTKLTKKQLREKVMHLQRVCEFLIEKIQPENADGLIAVAKPEGYGFEWHTK